MQLKQEVVNGIPLPPYVKVNFDAAINYPKKKKQYIYIYIFDAAIREDKSCITVVGTRKRPKKK